MTEPQWQVGCRFTFAVQEPARIVLQVAPSKTAGLRLDERLDLRVDGRAVDVVVEHEATHGGRIHVFTAPTGELSVDFAATVTTYAGPAGPIGAPTSELATIEALRQSRYCESDRLAGFATTEFADLGDDPYATAVRVAEWVFERLAYEVGVSGPLDSAVDTLLGGAGVCRDFAHLTISCCRALGIPARLAAVYAPGLSPMDFHAVTEVFVHGAWSVLDSTRLAPRSELVRIATGRDAADTAFATVVSGWADLLDAEVFASSTGDLAADDHVRRISLP